MNQELTKQAYQKPTVVVCPMEKDDVIMASTLVDNKDYITQPGEGWFEEAH